MKKGSRSARSTKWKPFDLSYLQYDDPMDLIESARHTPFDVHAKEFQPTPPLPRDSIYDYMSINDIQYLHNDGFQLVTNRRSRNTGLNPYQVREENRTSTVTAPYDKREINQVFGCDLPSPSYCQSRPGTTNGEIKFCIHPNGDVSAQQWFESQFQWINVGQYSNIRKRTEGQLASDRLRGETELQSLQQNTLAYFHAIARQREAAVMGRELNLQDLGAALSEYDISQRQASRQSATTTSIPTRPSSDAPVRYPVAVPLRQTHSTHVQQSSSQYGSTSIPTSPTPLARGQRAAHLSAPQSSPESRTGNLTLGSMTYSVPADYGNQLRLADINFGAYVGQHSHVFPSTVSPAGSRSSKSVLTGVPGISSMSGNVTPYRPRSAYLLDMTGESLHNPDNPGFLPQQSTRPRVPDSASSRNSANAGRTVMYDPLKHTPINASKNTRASASQQCHRGRSTSLFDYDQTDVADEPEQHTTRARQTTKYFTDVPLENLHDSVPDIDRYFGATQTKHMNPVDSAIDSMLLKMPPTPQILDQARVTNNRIPTCAEYNRELSNRFNCVNKAERHEDFYQSIMASSSPTILSTPSKPDPGVIGHPRSASKARSLSSESYTSPAKDEGITRLLIPVLENLASYVQGPMDQRHGHWAPFTAPPEWAIDKSLNGNNSFFEDDWLKPPERIGRDSRFRGVGGLGRFRGGSGV